MCDRVEISTRTLPTLIIAHVADVPHVILCRLPPEMAFLLATIPTAAVDIEKYSKQPPMTGIEDNPPTRSDRPHR